MKLGPVLSRQLRRLLQLGDERGLEDWLDDLVHGDEATREQQAQALRGLLRIIDATYAQHARDVALRTRSLDLSSNELTLANERLREETRAQKRLIDTLRATANELLVPTGAPPIGDEPIDAERLSALMLQLVREREAAIEASRISHERLALAIDSVQDTLWDWDLVTGQVYFSPRLAEILGKSGEVDLEPHIHPQDRENVTALRLAHLRGETSDYQAEFRVRNVNGSWRWLRSRGRVVSRDDAGRALRMVGTLSDVSDRRSAEDEVKHQLRFIEQLLDVVPNPIYFQDREGRVLGINQACERLFSVKRDKCRGRPLLELLDDDAARLQALNDQALFKDGGSQVYETRLRTQDGRWHDVVFSKILFSAPDDDAAGVLGVITDITEHKRVEIELRRATSTAEAASRAKGEFLANMSHEIRTPMNGILGLVELTLGSTLNDTQRRYLELVKSSASSLLTIINDILDVSRIEAGRLTLEEVPFELGALLHDALGPLEPRALEKGLDLTLEIDAGLPSEMVGDPLRLRQIVVNLVGNAIKFTRQGQVCVRAGVRRQGGTRYLRLSVADTGVGIAPDKLERIFESFTQADASTTREFGGTGLGLTISRRLANLMGGRLWAVSEPGAGSVFHLELPWRRAVGEPSRPCSTLGALSDWVPERAVGDATPLRTDGLELPPDPAAGPGVLEVLIVDDHAVNRFLATTLIRQLGHRVTCASSGAQALRLHGERSFDLMLLDIQMPEISGLEVAQRVRERERTSGGHCPIVALTAHAMPADRARSLAAGMDDHLAKPIDRERLSAILQLLSRAQQRHTA